MYELENPSPLESREDECRRNVQIGVVVSDPEEIRRDLAGERSRLGLMNSHAGRSRKSAIFSLLDLLICKCERDE
jgi:hypothetical protein